ncbi:MAG: penicillin-binding protein 2 [Thiomargarita sp.]|nr:penicillin-binding protein 2 [Thiomargarita sp.]
MTRAKLIIKDSVLENKIFGNRFLLAWSITLFMFLVIISRLFYLQIINYQHYTTLSEDNRIKVVSILPSRGLIYDRNGVLLAKNRISYSLEVIPEKVKNHLAMETMLNDLQTIITITAEDIISFKKKLTQTRSFKTVLLRQKLTENEVAKLAVQHHRFPSIKIKQNQSRFYPLGSVGGHIIGYVGRINEQELKTINKSDYLNNNYIGKIGLEKYYETELHGKTGSQHVEINVRGRIIRTLKRTPAVAGKDLYLNVDIAFQNYIEQLISKYDAAAVVAIEPKTGGILALASTPNYDPNLFVNGIDHKTYASLLNSEFRPLLNRAIRGQYPPGSTIKPMVGLAGLEYGIRTARSRTWCRGWYRLKGHKHRYRDWKRYGHGSMNLHTAIEQSCDVYFYSLAHDLGIERLHTFMNRFGFGKKTGIDLTGELSGLMPSREWKRRVRKQYWYPGETIITGIGQGFMLATPLQLAVATATLSNRGTIRQPKIVFGMDDEKIGEMVIIQSSNLDVSIDLKQEYFWDSAIGGMKAVVHGKRGSARKIAKKSKYRFAGKTGTAQVISIKQNERYDAKKLAKKYHDHSLFIAFAPLNNPEIALSIIVENGGSGSKTAAPLAKKILDYYLLNTLSVYLSTKN